MSERKAYQLAYYLKNKERMLKQDAEWYQNNKEHVKRRIYAYNDATTEIRAKKRVIYVAKNKTAVAAYQKQYYERKKQERLQTTLIGEDLPSI